MNYYNYKHGESMYEFNINLTAQQISKLINTYILNLPKYNEAKLTALNSSLQNDCIEHTYKIEFNFDNEPYEEGKYDDEEEIEIGGVIYYEYKTTIIIPAYEIIITINEYNGSKPCYIDLLNDSCGDRATEYCDNIIFEINNYLKTEEKILVNRYIEREQFLTFINSSIVNYGDFDFNNLKQVQSDKIASKKRQVLENHWYHRELLQFIENN